MPKEVDFPILPHLKKYIYQFYKIDKNMPVRVTVRSSLGIAMKHVLRERKKVNRKVLDRYTERITFSLSDSFANLELRSSFIIQFNVEYDRVFKENMRTWIMAQYDSGINNRLSIMNFLKFYNIKESEYSYDSAQRDWTRFKNQEYEREINM